MKGKNGQIMSLMYDYEVQTCINHLSFCLPVYDITRTNLNPLNFARISNLVFQVNSTAFYVNEPTR